MEKSLKILLGIILAIGVVAGGLSLSSVKFSTVPMIASDSCSGFNDIALSSVDYLSNDPSLGGKSWVLTVVQNCQGRYAVGTFTKDKITDSQDNAKAQYDLKITTSLDEQKCEYPIQQQGNPIYHMSYEKKTLFGILGKAEWKSECTARPGYFSFSEKPTGWGYYDYICYQVTQSGVHGIVGTSSTTFKSAIKLEANGQTKTATISNAADKMASIGDIGKAYWNGNLVTGDQCPIASDYRVGAAYMNGVWKTIDESLYQSYLGYDQTGFDDCIRLYLDYGTKTPDDCVTAYNTYESNALAGKQLVSVGGSAGVTTGDLSNGRVILQPVKLIQFPMITLRINAAWLGIFIPVGQPDITYAAAQEFQTGSTGIINVDVKNVGDGQGSFNIYATCPSPFSQIGTSQFLQLNPGISGRVSIPISCTANETTTRTCTVYAKDMNNPDKMDSAAVAVTCKPIIYCAAGERRCNGNYIEECKGGTGWQSIQKCDLGCEVLNNVPSCKTQKAPICGNGVCETGETYQTCSKDCGSGGGGTTPQIDWNIVGVLILIIMIAAFAAAAMKKKKRRVRHG